MTPALKTGLVMALNFSANTSNEFIHLSSEKLKAMGGERSEALQGLRALFIIAVLLTHFIVPFREMLLDATRMHRILYLLANMGWMGVDLFFTLSGFVVTLVLLRTRHGYVQFMRRRAARLLPAYFIMLSVVGVATVTAPILGVEVRDGFLVNQLGAWTLSANFAAAMHGGLLDGGSLSLIPVWSLAVEIQFYLIWPLIVWRWQNTRLLFAMAVMAAIALAARFSLGLFEVYYNTISSITPLRIDQFAMGGIAALLAFEGRNRWWAPWMAAGFLLPLLATLAVDATWHKSHVWVHTIGYFWLAAGASAAVLSVYQKTVWKPVLSVLSSRMLVGLGDRSYSIYLWHLAFYGLIRSSVSSLVPHVGRTAEMLLVVCAALVATALLSELSFRLVERPSVLNRKSNA